MFFAHSLSAPKVQLKAMETCATVAQVIELFNSYDRQYMATYQVIFGDKNGNSVIIESDSMIVKNGIIYIYHFHNYADVQIIDLKKELGKGEHSYSIPSLFGPATFAFSDFVKRSKIKTRTAVTMDSSKFNDYEGEYQLAPLPFCSVKIRSENHKLLCLIRGI